MVPESVEREVVIEAPVELVWSIVTEPEHVAKWLSDSVEIDLRAGGDAAFDWEAHGVTRARIEKIEAPHLFTFRWVATTGAHPGEQLTEGNSTLVEFHLSREGERTRLRVVETGFPWLERSEQERAEIADGHDGGWERELGELVEYVSRVRASA
jgi:uncharacterized protein YndB with AHSA1/START domain